MPGCSAILENNKIHNLSDEFEEDAEQQRDVVGKGGIHLHVRCFATFISDLQMWLMNFQPPRIRFCSVCCNCKKFENTNGNSFMKGAFMSIRYHCLNYNRLFFQFPIWQLLLIYISRKIVFTNRFFSLLNPFPN